MRSMTIELPNGTKGRKLARAMKQVILDHHKGRTCHEDDYEGEKFDPLFRDPQNGEPASFTVDFSDRDNQPYIGSYTRTSDDVFVKSTPELLEALSLMFLGEGWDNFEMDLDGNEVEMSHNGEEVTVGCTTVTYAEAGKIYREMQKRRREARNAD